MRRVLLTFLLLVPLSLFAERTNLDPVFWSDYYAFLQATPGELIEIKRRIGLLSYETRFVKHEPHGNIYRVPVRHLRALQKIKARLIPSPPFSLLVPDLLKRKQASSLTKRLEGYKDYELIKKILFELQTLFPDYARVYTIGRSTQGRPIYALKISDHPELEEDEPAFLFNGAHHGNEVLSPEYTLDLALYLLYGVGQFPEDKEGLLSFFRKFRKKINHAGAIHYRSSEVQYWMDNYEIWIVPVVNPDGLEVCWTKNVWAGRKNGRNTIGSSEWELGDGVDLNRNYPFYWNSPTPKASSSHPKSHIYRGPSPASEPETRAMMRLAERQRFVVSFSYHTYATRILTPYTIEGSISPSPNPSWLFAEYFVQDLKSYRSERDYITVRNLYPVDGTDQDWLFFKYGTLAYIVEGSYQNPPWEVARKSIRGLRPAALRALELYREGPVLVIHTVDPSGRPVGGAHVRLRETVFYEKEDHTSHPVTGRYDFILENGGRYTLEARAEGYEDAVRVLSCSSGHCNKRIVMTPLR